MIYKKKLFQCLCPDLLGINSSLTKRQAALKNFLGRLLDVQFNIIAKEQKKKTKTSLKLFLGLRPKI